MPTFAKYFLGKMLKDCYGRQQHALTLKLGRQL